MALVLKPYNFIRITNYCWKRSWTVSLGCNKTYRHNSTKATELKEEDLSEDAPIKYLTSEAATWKARQNWRFDIPKYQAEITSLSIAIFLIYFCILREENDIDEELTKPLCERVPGLEEVSLNNVLTYNRQHGLPTEDVEKRLKEIESLKVVNENK